MLTKRFAPWPISGIAPPSPTRESALARAEEMRAAKIASLKRQIERLESLEF